MELNGKIILKDPPAGSPIPIAVSDAGRVPGTLRPQSRVTTATLQMMPPPARIKQPFMVLQVLGVRKSVPGCTMFEAIQWGQTQQLDPGTVSI